MTRFSIKRSVGFLVLALTGTVLFAQNEMKPEDTEVWEPVPKVVTPGETNDAPPADALVLFNGSDLDQWSVPDDSNWEIKDGALTIKPTEEKLERPSNMATKESFGDFQLHIEWKAPEKIEGEGQRRGNSGIFLQSRYELQIQDCYQNPTYVNGQAGSIYKQTAPLVNPCRPPGEWQTYEVFYTAPRFDDIGLLLSPGYVTVVHNGVLIQNHTEIKGSIRHVGLPYYTPHGDMPLLIQDHGNPVSFRNIWIRSL